MTRLLCLLLTLLILLLPAAALGEGTALPGPGGLSRGQGTLLGTEAWDDGLTYQVYQYAFEKQASMPASSLIFVYQARLKKAGYAVEKIEGKPADERPFIQTSWYALSGDGQTAYFCLSGSYFATTSEGLLYVPEGMAVDPNPDSGSSSGGSSGSFQNPTRYSDYVDSDSFTFQNPTNYSDYVDTFTFQNPSYADAMENLPDAPEGPVTCQACGGAKTCPTCHGSGSWRNPYTGNVLICNCDNGLCSVCGGTGIWE